MIEKESPLHSTSPVYILSVSSEGVEAFLTKFGSSDPSFNRIILKLLYLKFKTSAHAQITFIITTYYLRDF